MSNIEWTDQTWNPVIGCTPVSPGCLNCYAATMARRLEAMGKKEYQPHREMVAERAPTMEPMREPKVFRIAEKKNGRAVFTGEVRTLEDRLLEPLKWKTPRRVFVNSMSDLFHEDVPFEFIDKVNAVMALCPQHTFQVLTKRPERMAEYFKGGGRAQRIWDAVGIIDLKAHEIEGTNVYWKHGIPANVWLGTSVERQQEFAERSPYLKACSAAVRFLSCEPLIECLKLDAPGSKYNLRDIHWVIVGGESGPNARPCDVRWIRKVVQQCKRAGVPVFVKQLGRSIQIRNDQMSEWPREGDGLLYSENDERLPTHQGDPMVVRTEDRKGGDMSEWPEDLRVREFPEVKG